MSLRKIGAIAATVARNTMRHEHFLFISFHDDRPLLIATDSVTDADYTQALHLLYEHLDMELDHRILDRINEQLAERRALRYEARETTVS